MAGKPDISATSNVQNVVVYVSNDNFAQAYAVGQQNVQQQNRHTINSTEYQNTSNTLAPMVGTSKSFKTNEQPNNGQIVNPSDGYYPGVISQNGFSQPLVNNINYQNGAVIKTSYSEGQQMGPGRPEKVRDDCDNREAFAEDYVMVMGAEVPAPSVRCDSVRSETAESSCSSLSSVDESLVVVQHQPSEMVVYDPSVSVQPGGVVLAVGPPNMPQQIQNSSLTVFGGTLNSNQQHVVVVPYGWKRISNNGSIIYISPSNTVLSSLEQVKDYLLTAGTCKCGLECHFKYESVFNFDPKVGSKPWVMTPDTNTGDLTKLCNHKRKIIAMASLDCKQSDANVNLRKDYNVKKKKRKIGLPYAGGVSVSQILAHREKLALNQNFSKDAAGSGQQVWHQSMSNSQMIPSNRLQSSQEIAPNNHMVRCQGQSEVSPVIVGENTVMMQHPNFTNNISNQPLQQNQQQIHISSSMGPVNIHSQQIIGPNGQIISLQGPISSQSNQIPHANSGGVVLQGHNVVQNQQHHQQRIFINGQPSEPSGPGRPNIQMIPVSIPNQQNLGPQNQTVQQRLPHPQQQIQYCNGQQQFSQAQQIESGKSIRPFAPIMNGFRPQGMLNQPTNQMMPMQQWPNRMHQMQQQQQQQQQPSSQSSQVPMGHASPQSTQPNIYERVPPLHQHTPSPTMWQEEIKRKKVKLGKVVKNRPYVMEVVQPNNPPCPNVDVRQIPGENRAVIINQMPHSSHSAPSPSFMEDPSGYLAQQTALLNNTINRQTGANGCTGYNCDSPITSVQQQSNSQTNEVLLPSNVVVPNGKQQIHNNAMRPHQNVNIIKNQQISQNMPMPPHQAYGQSPPVQPNVADSSVLTDQHLQYSQCQGCIADSMQHQQHMSQQQNVKTHGRSSTPNSTPGTPSSSGASEDPVTSSTFTDKSCNQSSPDTRPIQGGTVSTSNVSPMDCLQSDPPTPHPNTPTPPQKMPDTSQVINTNIPFVVYSQTNQIHQINQQIQQQSHHMPSQSPQMPSQPLAMPSQSIHSPQMPHQLPQQGAQIPQQQVHQIQEIPRQQSQQIHHQMRNQPPQQLQNQTQHVQQHQQVQQHREIVHYQTQNVPKEAMCCTHAHQSHRMTGCATYSSGVVTTMASGRTVGSNTITSVLAGRTNTATVSITSPSSVTGSSSPSSMSNPNSPSVQAQSVTMNVSKSPLEMVQSVVSSIQVPHTHQPTIPSSQISPQIIKHHSPTGLPPSHILVSSGGQLIMASTGNGQQGGVMAPPPPKLLNSQNGGMPPISVSPMVTNVTASVAQVIPAVAQQVLGQQTVLVNALPAPFVLQPGVTMTMDGMTVGQNMPIPQLVAGNVIQQQIQIDNSDPRRVPALLSPETKKKGKKRKMSQTVANMLHIAAQQNSGVVMSQQGFPQQIQMAHSPQGITTGPVMQALTIVPSKSGGPPQIVMNGQPMANANLGAQQLITNSQPTQQINLLQPVNLINGPAGVVQNFPAFQQFIVPNLGGMVMNPDGTATILQDASNLGMQLQIQNVNGQNMLTPVQNNAMFNGGQSILAAGPAGMVIRAPTSQGKIIQQQQQHSPGAQFLSPNGGQFVVNGAQFGGQLSPLVASVSPSQQVTFSTAPQQIRPSTSMQSNQQEYIQMNGQMGQTLMVPCTPAASIAVSTANQQQNTTFVQQNTTIVQQQTTMVANNQQLQNFQQNNQQQSVARGTTLNVDQQNYIINANDNKQMQTVVVQQQQREIPQNSVNYRQSVSTQTAVNQNAQSVTTNTFCHSSTVSAGSPPDTTTLSPLASGGQSPATADTTTHTGGSTDDGLSPAPSNCSTSEMIMQTRPQSCTMAMVHCISSSEPDSAELNNQMSEQDWRRGHQMSTTPKSDYTDVTSAQSHFSKKSPPTHVTFVESSNLASGLQYITDQMKQQETVVSSRNYEKMMQHKRKNSGDTLVIMETHHMHTSLYEDDEESRKDDDTSTKTFVVGDLVWGPTKNCSSWPGKIVEVNDDNNVTVRWFGTEKYESKVDRRSLQTLTEGLDCQHQSRKKTRTSRKLNSDLEKAIQEAMSELDKEQVNSTGKEKTVFPNVGDEVRIYKKTAGRLRSSKR